MGSMQLFPSHHHQQTHSSIFNVHAPESLLWFGAVLRCVAHNKRSVQCEYKDLDSSVETLGSLFTAL